MISIDVIASLLEREGLAVQVLLRSANEDLNESSPVLRISDRRRQLDIYPNSLYSLLFELLRADSWARGTAELIRSNVIGKEVMHRFANDHIAWQPRAIANPGE